MVEVGHVMKNFLRGMRFAWPYRYRTIFSVICAILAAAFWGLNFTAIYPVLKIIGSNQNLQEWVQGSIDKVNEQIVPLQNEVNSLIQREQSVAKDNPKERESARARDKDLQHIAR